jgi:HlyD family secretion protein
MKHRKRNSKNRFFRLLKWLLVLGVCAGLAALAFMPKAVEIDAGQVVRGGMRLTVDDDGETRVRERYTLTAPLQGRLLRIALDPGDSVQKGDLLATIEPAVPDLIDSRARARAEAAVKAAQASVASAQTQVRAREVEASQLEKAFARNKLLLEKGNVAESEFEKAESAYLAAKHARETAEAGVEIVEFELQQARTALMRFDTAASDGKEAGEWDFKIHSPIDGKVLRVYEKSSRRVDAGTVLLEVGDPAKLEMRIDVLSEDAVKIEPGQTVLVEHWGGDTVLAGSVRRVEPSGYTKVSALGVDEQRVDVIADFQSPATPGAKALADGYRVEARIVVWEKADVLQVPTGALFRRGENWAVYRVEGEHARLATLELGRNNGEVAEVLSGLRQGDLVVLHPGDSIEEGTLVSQRK